VKVVIVGGVACGAKTAARLSRICRDAEITILERGTDLSYANCGFPFFLGGEVKDKTGLTHMGFGPARDAGYFERYAFTKALTGHEVTSIDRERKEVTAKAAGSGTVHIRVFPYDKLVLATGASPIRPSLPGLELGNVFTLWTLRDTLAIEEALSSQNLKRAVIAGAGLVGIETAEALKHRGLDVTLIDALPCPLFAVAGPEFGAMLQTRLEKNGVAFYGGEALKELRGRKEDGRKVGRILTEKREVDADIVVLAVGVRPNVELARNAGLAIGSKAVAVDEFQRTSDPDIYAGGDCAESRNILTGRPLWQPMGSTANRQGRVIADHIAGLNSKFEGVEGTAIARVFDWSAGKTGLTFEEAKDAGFSPVEILTSNPDLPGFMPGTSMLHIRLVADAARRVLLGARIIGPGRADKRLDVVAAALKGGLTVDGLADTDLAYAPPFSSALDPVTHAANALRTKMDGLVKSCGPVELKAKAGRGDDFIVLDVREKRELELFGVLPYALLHIPLGELKEKGAQPRKISKKREAVIVCRAGVRAWSAYAMLARYGYTKLLVLEGGMSAWPYETLKYP
jgi:NADPH-dependent 2,4-dienoyl-CoA reductase/sulfur reductase-like enzyme/rhodanese-related sulfurtransferase